METMFIIQLITSFLVGGIFIAFLSFLAEKASEKTAGLIITIPSTIAISFFFIGWTLSPQEIANIAPVTLLTLGVIGLSTIAYLSLSKIKLKKIYSIILCTASSLFIWFLFAVPLAIFKFSNLLLAIIGFLILAAIPYYFVTIKSKTTSLDTPIKYSTSQKIARAAFAGVIISLAVFLSKTLGPFWGGIFSSFPAKFTTSLIIIHWHYNSNFLFKVWKNFPLGFLTSATYPIAAIYTFPKFGIWLGTLIAYAISLLVFLIVSRLSGRS
jgi:hypothetical protein